MGRKRVTNEERAARRAVVEQARTLTYSAVGTRVKLENRVFLVRKTKGGRVMIAERLYAPSGLIKKDEQAWHETKKLTPLWTRVLQAAIEQKRAET